MNGDDPRIERLAEIGRMMRELRAVEPERDQLIRELVRDHGRGAATRIAAILDLTRGRVHQIVTDTRRNAR